MASLRQLSFRLVLYYIVSIIVVVLHCCSSLRSALQADAEEPRSPYAPS